MSDETLKAMLETAERTSNERDRREREEKQEREDQIVSSGVTLAARILPRLREAQQAWKDKLNLNVEDASAVTREMVGRRVYPQIRVSASAKAYAGFAFEAYSGDYVCVKHLSGRNRGNQAYEFKSGKIVDLSDDTIDQVLGEILQIVYGLKSV